MWTFAKTIEKRKKCLKNTKEKCRTYSKWDNFTFLPYYMDLWLSGTFAKCDFL